MKKLIIAAAALMVSLAAYGQGSFAFNNRVPPGIDAKIMLQGETTSSVAGDAYSWQLLGGAAGTTLAAAQSLATGTFRTGNAAGYVNPPAGAITVPGVAGGKDASIWLSVFSGATATGSPLSTFGPFTVTLQEPPNTPGNLPLGTTPLVVVPEPTTLALAALGLGSLLFIRRRK